MEPKKKDDPDLSRQMYKAYQEKIYDPSNQGRSINLKQRLVSQGLKVRTMPSVLRPFTSQTGSRPLTAKLKSVNNKVIESRLQPQSTVLNNPLLKIEENNRLFYGTSNAISHL